MATTRRTPTMSLPPAIDYLMAQVRHLESVKRHRVEPSDGWPAVRSDNMLVIGLNPDEDDTSADVTYVDAGGTEAEQVTLPGVIVVRRVGEGAASKARIAAFEILADLRALVERDRKLGGAIKPPAGGARLVRYRMAPTSTARQAGEGRVIEITWWLQWQHRS